MKNYIYILVDPETLLVRYVGKTTSIKRRYNQHIEECSRIKSHKNNWIFSLKNKGLKPEMVIIDELEPEENWTFWEQFYICLYKSWGFKLTNLTEGGEGNTRIKGTFKSSKPSPLKGIKRSQEFKEKISQAVRDRKYSIQQKEKFSETAKKRGISLETHIKMRQSRLDTGWKHSIESKKLISEKMKIVANARIIKNNRRGLGNGSS